MRGTTPSQPVVVQQLSCQMRAALGRDMTRLVVLYTRNSLILLIFL